jgi:hypothetical protein
MEHLHLARMLFGIVMSFLIGGVLVISAFVEKKGLPGFGDLYPGLSAIAAGCVLLGFVKWVMRDTDSEDVSAGNAEAESDGPE